MKQIQRYDVLWREEEYVRVKDVNGPYVLYEDHLKAAEEVKEKLKTLRDGFAESIEARER